MPSDKKIEGNRATKQELPDRGERSITAVCSQRFVVLGPTGKASRINETSSLFLTRGYSVNSPPLWKILKT